jgi:hypothetical protein
MAYNFNLEQDTTQSTAVACDPKFEIMQHGTRHLEYCTSTKVATTKDGAFNVITHLFVLIIRIWDHLENLTKNDGTTIVITTHYMEEICCAQKVVISSSAFFQYSLILNLLRLELFKPFHHPGCNDEGRETSRGS